MTVSMRVMSAGDGYKYLLRTVAAGDGKRSLSTPLTRYYSAEGTPPGVWLGAGVSSLGSGEIAAGDEVSESQLQLLIGMGVDPVSGSPLGRAYPTYRSSQERTEARVSQLDASLGVLERAQAVAQIEQEEATVKHRKAVAGYDFTFSIPKAASVLWAVADGGTQALIADAHHAAVAEMVAYMEREVAATRTGTTALDGAVAQADVAGLIATAYDHFDSRAGDPHLHTHVVISNKVKTLLDGRWRSLDGRPMHAATVALSELHEAVFADHLTRLFGVEWEARSRGRDRNDAWTIAGVPAELEKEFSTRARGIDQETDRLVAEYVETHGRRPSPATVMKLRAQATLSTRPDKEIHSLTDLTASWRARAAEILKSDPTAWASSVTGNDVPLVLRADDIPLDVIATLGRHVVEAVGEKRATWRRWNLTAEAARQTMPYRFSTTQDREVVVGMIVDAAESESLRLTPQDLAVTPANFQRTDGSSVFRPRHSTVSSSEALLAAEDRLLAHSRDLNGPALDVTSVERAIRKRLPGSQRLGDDQAEALVKIAVSGRVLDVLVGPAGAGKTTALRALRIAWETQHGPHSVVGLAPSAAAAQVLGDDLGIGTENTARWWTNHELTGATFSPRQLVIIDEASLAGTLSLDRITGLAGKAGAKILLVGDYGQLQAVDAGGAFGMLVDDREADLPELTDVHRFSNDWEKLASLELRHGRTDVIDTYLEHGRVSDGDAEAMLEAAYAAWRHDSESGKRSVLIAETRDDVAALNNRARADLIMDGVIEPTHEVALHDGSYAGEGDTIVTRRNDRRLRTATGRGWIKNGITWSIRKVNDDGSLVIRHPSRRIGGNIVLPAQYVAEHVELGYAVTAHRAQGLTVDTAHALVEPTSTRENLYVAMTRGRESNRAYVVTDRPDELHRIPHPDDDAYANARAVLYGVLQHLAAEPTAHETITVEQEHWGSIAQLAAEYETIAAAAQRDRWASVIRHAPLSTEQQQQVLESDAFGALAAELRAAEANRHDVEALVPRLVAARGFDDADDIASVLHYRVARATARPASSGHRSRSPQMIVGLIAAASGPMAADMQQALTERQTLINARAETVLNDAINDERPWTAALGTIPGTPGPAEQWHRAALTVAAYRDRYGVISDDALGPDAETETHKADRARAQRALERARTVAGASRGIVQQAPRRPAPVAGIGL
ncbi:MobF family relaxase [Microbacterium nanhaiense]|nr:MobF family relaxase [Microbacterium nanhaiense]